MTALLSLRPASKSTIRWQRAEPNNSSNTAFWTVSWCIGEMVLKCASDPMTRLTISLPDELHQALKETAARRRQTIGDLIAESLEFYGIKTTESAQDLVAQARGRARMTERQALSIAGKETRQSRRR